VDWANVPRGAPERFFDEPPTTLPEAPSTRAVEAADIARLDELDADDFAIDLDSIEVPQAAPLSDADVHALVQRFLDAVDAGDDR
jgi:hypothetical protein